MTDVSYDPAHYADLAAAERRHFWFRHRNHVIRTLVRRAGGADARRALEIGCGTGNVLGVLTDACPSALVCGLEVFRQGLDIARGRTSASLVQARIEALPFGAVFDIVGMFDVLEHLPDDRDALAAARRGLAPAGRLLLTVPAYAWLWSAFDEASGHVRRYSPRTLREAAESAGFRVLHLTHFMAPLVPLVWLARHGRPVERADAVSRELHVSPVANAAALAVLALERPWLTRAWRIPLGTSIAVVAEPR